LVTSLKTCQRYSCLNNVCTLKNQPDGTDCSVIGAAAHSICVAGVCKAVVLGLGAQFNQNSKYLKQIFIIHVYF
jgi:hypothetical protein